MRKQKFGEKIWLFFWWIQRVKSCAETGSGELPILYQLKWQKRLGKRVLPFWVNFVLHGSWLLTLQVIIKRKFKKKIMREIKRRHSNRHTLEKCPHDSVCTSSLSPTYHPKSLLKLMKMGTALYSNKECTGHYSPEKCVTRLSLENGVFFFWGNIPIYICLKIQVSILVKPKQALIKGMLQILGLAY